MVRCGVVRSADSSKPGRHEYDLWHKQACVTCLSCFRVDAVRVAVEQNRVWMRLQDEQHGDGGFADKQRSVLAPLRLQSERVPRTSLMRRLDRLTPFTRVSAPHGTGRTTLLADWAMRRMDQGDHVLWVSAHPGLNSCDAFNQQIAHIASDVVSPSAGDPLTQICAAHPHTRVIVIVDDGNLITDVTLRDWLVDLCRKIPTLHIVGSTDEVRPLPIVTTHAHVPSTRITGRDLMVSAAEAVAFARAWGHQLDDAGAVELVEETGGWLGLMREVLDGQHSNGARAAGGSSTASDDTARAVRRFRESIPLSAPTESLVAEVGAVAALGSVTESLLAHLEDTRPEIWTEIGAFTDAPLADVLIDSGLLRRVPSIAARPEDGRHSKEPGPSAQARARTETFLEVPRALRAVLAHEFGSTHPVRTRQLHGATAAFFEDSGNPKNLIRSALHARQAHDWTRLTRLAARHGWWFGVRYGSETIEAYGSVPDEAARTRPVLLMTRALAHALPTATIETDARSPMVQRVFARASEGSVHRMLGSADPNERVFLVAAMVNALRQRGDGEGALRLSEELRPSLTPRWDDVTALNRAFFYLHTGLAALDAGELPRAVRRFTRAYEESGGAQSQFVACSAAGHAALILAFEGRREAALHWARRAEDGAVGEPWIERIVRTPVLLAHAHMALDDADLVRATRLLTDTDPFTGVIEAWPMLLDVHARLALAVGTPLATLDAIEHAAHMHQAGRPAGILATALITRARCSLLIAEGELTRAQVLIDRTLLTGGEATERADVDYPRGAGPAGMGGGLAGTGPAGAGAGPAGAGAAAPSWEEAGASGGERVGGADAASDAAVHPAEVPPFIRRALSIAQARLWVTAGRYTQARQVISASLAHAPTRRQTIDMLVLDAAAALALELPEDAARSIGRVVSMAARNELAVALRALDVPTRRKLLALVDGVHQSALPAPDDSLFTQPAMYPSSAHLIELTERETSVLRDLAAGASLAEIARSDVLSINTVKKQTVSLYRKLQADNRADALRIAYEQGLLG